MAFKPQPRERVRQVPQPVPVEHRRGRMATAEDFAAPPPRRSGVPALLQSPAKKRATAAEQAHMGRVAKLGCVLCAVLGQPQSGKTDVHHIREEQGGAQRAPNWLVAALCHEGCHQGPRGIHGDRSLLRQAKCTELDLLAWTMEALAKEARR